MKMVGTRKLGKKHSSMSMGDIIAVRHIYDKLAQKLELQQIA